MAENSGFFDAHLVEGQYDRVYLAESFAKYFSNFIGNGIFGGKSNELMVQQKSTADMSVKLLTGKAFINGYWYENDDELSLSIDVADGVLNRIDLIVLRWNNSERVIRATVKKGTLATNASAPQLQRDDDFYELAIAKISVKAGATKITQADIVDTRLDTNICGFVVGLIKQFDTTDFGLQINGVIERLEKVAEENDVASLILAIESLERNRLIGYESTQYPGCYYREIDGQTEWLNPPEIIGVEYRTAERFDNKPVYQKLFYVAAMPNKTTAVVKVGIPGNNVVAIQGFVRSSETNDFNMLPMFRISVDSLGVVGAIDKNGDMLLVASTDLRTYKGYITVKYVKS